MPKIMIMIAKGLSGKKYQAVELPACPDCQGTRKVRYRYLGKKIAVRQCLRCRRG